MRGLAVIAALGLALVVALPDAIGLQLQDVPSPGDADLLAPSAPAPAGANAFDALGRTAAALGEDAVDADIRAELASDPFDVAAAEARIAGQQAALAAFRAALRAPSFRMPEAGLDDELPDVQTWFTAARLHALEARLHFERDEVGRGGEALVALLALGRRIQRDPGATWIQWIAGAELKEIAARTLVGATATWQPSAADSLAWNRALAEYANDPDDARRAWAGEYRAIRAALLAESEFPAGSYSFHPNRTLALHAARTRALQARAGRPCGELRAEPETPPPSRLTLLLRGLRPNAVGEILAEVARPNDLGFALRRCASDTQHAAAGVVVALAAMQRETGALPASLDELVPVYLDEVPTGAYDRAPLRLDRAERRVVAGGSKLPDATLEQQSPEYPLPF